MAAISITDMRVLGFTRHEEQFQSKLGYVHFRRERRSMSFDYEQWKQSQFSATPHQEAASIPFPASITLAGMIWAAAGVIALLTEAVLFLQTGNSMAAFGR
jgi:hypothetical protein